ncbi:MAG TPA: DUF3857 domain-containing protein [Chthonomonadaceae bacterium]|nr:DUF3857 domain-containing protein [Chthonomonadaceae bacterium]
MKSRSSSPCGGRRLRARFWCAPLTALLLLPVAPLHAAPPGHKSKAAAPKTAPKPAASAIDPVLAEAIKNAPQAGQWPNNDYARILDLGDVTVRSDGTVVGEYRETYKLFNERARLLAEVNLPYNSSYQTVKVVRARTIKKNGTVVDVKPEDIRSASPYSDYLLYDDAMAVSFSMPAIEDDCIIDYTYQMISKPMALPGQFWTYWGFSGPEPVSISRYVLHAPADKPLKFKVYNDESVKPTIALSKDGRTRTYTWEMRNIAPIVLEPSMPGISEVRVWMEVSSLGSWQDIARWFWGLQQPQAKPTDAIRATVNTLTAGMKTDDEKARALYDWVANRTRYVGLEFGISAFKPHPAADVYDKLYGDCKDKATLLITMLGLAGIKAHPVLLHAGERSPFRDRLPSLNAFNHCIALAEVGGKEVWLDATAETCAYGDIPDADRGVQALVVQDGTGEWKTIPTYKAEENGLDVTAHIALHPDGSADVQNALQWRGAAGQALRATVRSITPDKRKQMMQGLAQSFSAGASITDFTLPDGTDKLGPFEIKLNSTAPNWAKKTGSLLLLPMSNWRNGSERRNPYVQEKRVWTIVEEDTSLTRTTTVITLPEGYSVEDVPEDVHLVGPLQEYHRTLVRSADGKTLTVTETQTEHPGKVPPSDYAKVKAYYDSLIKIADDQIVLKKAK